MTKLEFINEEIEDVKDYLKDYKEYHLKSKKYTIARLELLQQIKTDLEAWEVVKKYLFVDKNIFEEDWEEFEYEYIRFINENICPMHESNFEEIDIIKKALEVKDE